VIAHEHGHDSASAAFEYTLADFKLAQHAAQNLRWSQLRWRIRVKQHRRRRAREGLLCGRDSSRPHRSWALSR
jgi:hypothetical protein